MPVIEIKTAEEFEDFISKNAKVAVDFTASWCAPCQAISPVFEQLSQIYLNLAFASVNVDNVAAVAEKFSVRSMPTFLLFKDGQKVGEMVGADVAKLKKEIQQFQLGG